MRRPLFWIIILLLFAGTPFALWYGLDFWTDQKILSLQKEWDARGIKLSYQKDTAGGFPLHLTKNLKQVAIQTTTSSQSKGCAWHATLPYVKINITPSSLWTRQATFQVFGPAFMNIKRLGDLQNLQMTADGISGTLKATGQINITAQRTAVYSAKEHTIDLRSLNATIARSPNQPNSLSIKGQAKAALPSSIGPDSFGNAQLSCRLDNQPAQTRFFLHSYAIAWDNLSLSGKGFLRFFQDRKHGFLTLHANNPQKLLPTLIAHLFNEKQTGAFSKGLGAVLQAIGQKNITFVLNNNTVMIKEWPLLSFDLPFVRNVAASM